MFTFKAYKALVFGGAEHVSCHPQARYFCLISYKDGKEKYTDITKVEKDIQKIPIYQALVLNSPLIYTILYAYKIRSVLSRITFISYLDDGENVHLNYTIITINRHLQVHISEEKLQIASLDYDLTKSIPKKYWKKGFLLFKKDSNKLIPIKNVREINRYADVKAAG